MAVRVVPDGDPLASLRTLGISAPGGEHIPLQQIAEITKTSGLAQILREDNGRRLAIKWSARGRDIGSLVAEAMEKVQRAVSLPPGYHDGPDPAGAARDLQARLALVGAAALGPSPARTTSVPRRPGVTGISGTPVDIG